jgi:formylmethanofuran dehydrogenase subunit E
MTTTNAERAQRAETALAGYTGGDPDDFQTTIIDLVTDLLHLAHENGFDVEPVTDMALTHFKAEWDEENPDEDNTENVLIVGKKRCDNCGAEVSEIIGCPDGKEVCRDCFDAGAD